MNLAAAISDWRTVLGAERVLEETAAQDSYGRCTSGARRRIAGAVRARAADDVAEVVAIAARHGVPIYPVSTGHNWGYGTSLPARDDCVVLDLSALDRIVAFDPGTGIVTVEPGVTQQQLADFLDAGDHPFLVPVSGAGPSCSILGNAVERGYGITPHADHFGAVMAIEAVLADGRIYRSALAEADGADVDDAFKWGIGPYLDGLFTQSAMGVVTRMSIALARRPQAVRAFFFGLPDAADLGHLVERVREVIARYPGVVGGVNLMNARRVLSMSIPYPRDRLGADGLIPDALIDELGRANQVMAWTGFGTLYGSRGVVRAAQREIRAVLRPYAKRLVYISPFSARWLARLGRLLPGFLKARVGRSLEVLETSIELVAGRPNETAMPLCYWIGNQAARAPGPLDPARDGCGVAWYAPLIPMRAERVQAYVAMVDKVMREHGLEPLITLTSLSERCFDSTIPLLFDLDDAGSTANAQACRRALLEAGRAQGFLPYRVGIDTMDWLVRDDATCWQMVRDIKQALDPGHIIAPGRYV